MKIIYVVAAVIFDNDQNILITKRKHELFNGLWEFPGGKVEPNETNEEALKREIKEELNLDIELNKFLTRVEYDYPTFHLVMDVYVSKIISGFIDLTVHSEIKWVKKSELDSVEWVPADIPIIKALKNK